MIVMAKTASNSLEVELLISTCTSLHFCVHLGNIYYARISGYRGN